ncbi:MAG: VOC family protein [Pseudomonadota bacterium]
MRIRQLVWATGDMEAGDKLKRLLGLGEPFRDPGVEVFGLVNVVHPVGDQFLEIVFPVTDTAPARRFLDRAGGPGGYMAIFETDDLPALRARADEMGVRRVWDIDLEDIAASHLHPADVGAAIVSVDQPVPAGAWRWGGPDWEARRGAGDCVGLRSAALTSPDPERLARRWADVLGLDARDAGDGWRMTLDGGEITVREGAADSLAGFGLACADPGMIAARAAEMGLSTEDKAVEFQGVRLTLHPAD